MFVGYRDENVVNMLTDFGGEAVIIRIQLPSLVEIFEHNVNAFGVHQERRRSILTLLTINFTYFTISSKTMRFSSCDRPLSFALKSLYKSMLNLASSTEGEIFFFLLIIVIFFVVNTH